MRRLTITLATVGLALAVWVAPSLAGPHKRPAHRASTTRHTASSRARSSATGDLLRASLAPSVPADPAIDGAKPGAAPWVLRSGDVVVSADGRVVVHLAGFLIPGKGVGPVRTLTASVYCDASTTAAATTTAAKLSSRGDATIDATAKLPASCFGPVVLVHPNGQAGSYVAASGWAH